MTPVRIRRRRAPGWRKPAGAVIVDRTSRWGNPFTVAQALADGIADDDHAAHELCARRYRSWILGSIPEDPDVLQVGNRHFDRRWIREHLYELRGRSLCCPCPEGEACHGEVLLELANEEPPPEAVSQ
ncbi:DUF4326 domain-containing protein [Nonomuraea sp. NPDC049158]|uniref:DUF4326 domain-containing protein n=1 Tax=Nonomuraea sp. NPDC049158 TaxID=3155649 RepID=UPI0033C07FC6